MICVWVCVYVPLNTSSCVTIWDDVIFISISDWGDSFITAISITNIVIIV